MCDYKNNPFNVIYTGNQDEEKLIQDASDQSLPLLERNI